MPQIEGIVIKNFRALADVSMGSTSADRARAPLPRMLAVIGPNGSGKSSLMDALGFIGDCLARDVEAACDQPHRGGFERLRTRGSEQPIEFELTYRQSDDAWPIRYTLRIAAGGDGRPYVAYERLQQRRVGATRGRYFSFLELSNGRGYVWAGDSTKEERSAEKIYVQLEDPQRLGITTLGNLAEHPRIVAFRQFLEGWYLSYFVPDIARGLPMAGAQKHLDRRGENLANYVQYLERQHSGRFKRVLEQIARKIPGVERIRAERAKDGRLLLAFNDRGFTDPFYAQDMSDGTLKMFAYLVLLEDPEPAPLIGIEEPENGLHHQLLEPLAAAMRDYANQPNGSQVVVTTHSPYFVDGMLPTEVFQIVKDAHGHSAVRRAADVHGVPELFDEGLPLGSLWYSGHFGRLPSASEPRPGSEAAKPRSAATRVRTRGG